MKYCQNCGKEIGENNLCPNCGKANNSINKKEYKLIIYGIISLVLGIVCFIPKIYLANRGYLIAGAYVPAQYGNYSELNRWNTLKSLGSIGLVLGIMLCIVFVILVGLHIYRNKK